MQKQKQLNRWFWKWHVIAGLISLPFMLLLSITGIIYLFKADFNNAVYNEARFVSAEATAPVQSYDAQLAAVKATTDHHVVQLILPAEANQASAFRLHGKKGDHTRNIVYVNPYTAEVTGQVNQRDTLMYTVRKLHGELLLSKAGTLTIELVASWFLVLIITGVYVWWPSTRFAGAGLGGFFTIRTQKGKRILFRDLHAVGGFWLSIAMAIILAGGMPWTDMFGSELKWVQKHTDTGYPKNWNNNRGVVSDITGAPPLSLDRMVEIANAQQLPGKITIKLPMSDAHVFSVSNHSLWLADQDMIHIDQYSGKIVEAYQWSDVGILMELRQIAMRLHQGEYGFANWIIVLLIVLVFTITTIAGLISYLIRKPKGRWAIPKVPEGFRVSYGVAAVALILGVVFPMFGASLVLILMGEQLSKLRVRRSSFTTESS